jgi:Cdc6-like AAA superfamily ATPase
MPNEAFEELWEKAVNKYFASTHRTYSEKVLLKQLKGPDDLQKQLETNHNQFVSFRARHGKLTGTLKKTVQPFIMLSGTASSAISLSPFAPASTILGAVVFLVQATNGVSEAYDWIEQLFDKLGDFTARLDEYIKGGVSAHLETKVIQILGCLLEILARSEKTIKDGRWKRYAAVLFLGRDEEIKASFEDLTKLFESEQRLVIAITFATNQRMEKRIEEMEKIGKQTVEAVNRAESDKMLEWLSSFDFPAKQSDFIASRREGTGQWFLDSSQFTKWLCTPKQILFCPGIPGAGKTMMAAITIDHLITTTRSDSIGIAYVYCNYKEQKDQNTASLLGAILKQLVYSQPSIPEPVSKMYERRSGPGTRPSLEDIFDALKSVLRYYSTIYIVFDGLDECSDREGTRNGILNKIRGLQKETDIRLMVTSRFIPEIVEEFKHALRLEVRATAADVRRFVASKICELPKCIQRDKELQDLVQDRITEAVDGMLVYTISSFEYNDLTAFLGFSLLDYMLTRFSIRQTQEKSRMHCRSFPRTSRAPIALVIWTKLIKKLTMKRMPTPLKE